MEVKNCNKCVNKTHIDKRVGGRQLKLYAQHSPPPIQRQHFRRSLHASIHSTQGVENNVSAKLTNIISASCDLNLVPPDSRSCPCRGEDLRQFALVTEERTNGRTKFTFCRGPMLLDVSELPEFILQIFISPYNGRQKKKKLKNELN